MAEDVEVRSPTSLTVFSKHGNCKIGPLTTDDDQTIMDTVNKYLCRCDVRHVVRNIDLSSNRLPEDVLQLFIVFVCPKLQRLDLSHNCININSKNWQVSLRKFK